MFDKELDLAARAKWCRRLAENCEDARLKASLEDIAAELEQRAQASPPDQLWRGLAGESTQ